MVLPASAGDGTVVDGVDRTVMVAGQTTGTLAVMEPLGRGTLDVVYRTDFCALATMDTDIRIDHKLLVGNHPLVEITANDIGIESWGGTLFQGNDTFPTVLDSGDDF